MRDGFIEAMNSQKIASEWMAELTENLTNSSTPGYREKKLNFKTILEGGINDTYIRNPGQGKSTPGTSPENLYLEGNGFFVLKNDRDRVVYTRLGEFTFDSEGVYRAKDGQTVQGYILNDKGEIMNGAKPVDSDSFLDTSFDGGAAAIPTTDIKIWIDPSNGKYLGKYEEIEFKEDGIIYGKSDGGKYRIPLYKVAILNFHNPQELYQVAEGQFIETKKSGKPVAGRGEVRSGLLELSNIDFDANSTYYNQAKFQMQIADQLMKSHKQLLQNILSVLER